MWNEFSWRIRRVVRLPDPIFLPDRADVNIIGQLQFQGSYAYGKYFSTNVNNCVFFGALST